MVVLEIVLRITISTTQWHGHDIIKLVDGIWVKHAHYRQPTGWIKHSHRRLPILFNPLSILITSFFSFLFFAILTVFLCFAPIIVHLNLEHFEWVLVRLDPKMSNRQERLLLI